MECDENQETSFNIQYTGNKETSINKKGTHYTAEVTDLGNNNYALPTDGSATTDWTISQLAKDITVSGTKGTNGWYQSKVEIGAGEGYHVLLQALKQGNVTVEDSRWQNTWERDIQGDHTLEYYVKELSSDALSLVRNIRLKIDTEAPTGSVQISGKDTTYTEWNADWSYENIFKNSVNVTVTGKDVTSGVERIEYTVADKNSDVRSLTWTSVALKKDTKDAEGQTKTGFFTIRANQKGSIWVRITDAAGNQSVINTAGIVVYTDSATTAKDVTYGRKSLENQTLTVKANGNTVSSVKNGNDTLTDSDYSVAYTDDGKQAEITFNGSYLDTLSRGTYPLTIEYDPYGVEVDGASDILQKTAAKLNVIRNSKGTITNISDMDKDVDGTPVSEPSFDSTNEKGTNNENVTFEYKKKGAADGTYTTTAPSERGRYVVRITVKEDDSYEKVSVTKEFWIHDELMTILPSNTETTYDGSGQGIQLGASDQKTGNTKTDITIEYGTRNSGNKIVYSNTPTTYKNAGSYTIYYRVSATGYETVTDSVTFTILPKPVSFVWSNTEFTYNGKIQIPTAEVNPSDLVNDDASKVTVGGGAKDAGTHTATVSKLSNPNYTVSEGEPTASGNYVINPKTVTVKLKAEDKTYDKTTDAVITGTVPEGLEKGDSLMITGKGTFAQTGAGEQITVTPDTSESSMQVTGSGSTNAGNYRLVYDTSDTLTATINKADRKIRVTDVSDPKNPVFTADDGDSTSATKDIYNQKTISYKRQGETDNKYTELKELPTKCGTYIIRVTIPEDDNYLESSGVAKYTVAHNWTGDWETVTEATATTEGTKVKYCQNKGCKEKIYGTIPAGSEGSTGGGSTSAGGNLEKAVRTESGSPISSASLLNEKDRLKEDTRIITETDKSNLQAGTTNIIVNLVISKTEADTLMEADTTQFKNTATNAGADESTLNYFDVDLFKVVQTKSGDSDSDSNEDFNHEETTKITKTNDPLKISVTLPSSLRASGNVTRTYRVLRLHDGVVDVLASTYDSSANQLKFESDSFSTYAVAYKDTVNKSSSGGNSNSGNDSGDNNSSDSSDNNSSSGDGSNNNSDSNVSNSSSNKNTNTLTNKDQSGDASNNVNATGSDTEGKNTNTAGISNDDSDDSSLNDAYSALQARDPSNSAEDGNDAGQDEAKEASSEVSEDHMDSSVNRSSTADDTDQTSCRWHWLILVVALLGLLVAALLGRKKQKYSWIAAAVTSIINLIFALVGSCRLDWFFLLAEVVLMLCIILFLLRRRDEEESAN